MSGKMSKGVRGKDRRPGEVGQDVVKGGQVPGGSLSTAATGVAWMVDDGEGGEAGREPAAKRVIGVLELVVLKVEARVPNEGDVEVP